MALIGGLITSILLVLFAAYDSADSARRSFLERTASIQEAVLHRVKTADEVIHGLTTLFYATTAVDADQFRLIAEDILQRHDYLKSALYLPYVTDQQRTSFESQIQDDGYVTYSINEYLNQGYQPAPPKSAYLPILYVEPFTPRTAASMGFDILSHPMLEQAALYAIDSAHAASTIPFPQQTHDGRYLIVKALYTGKTIPQEINERRRSVSGLLVLEMDMQGIASSINDVAEMGIGIDLIPASLTQSGQSYPLVRPQNAVAGNFGSLFLNTVAHTSNITLPGLRLSLSFKRTLSLSDIGQRTIVTAAVIGVILTTLFVLIARRIQGLNEERLLRGSELRLRKFNGALTALAKSDSLAKGEMQSGFAEINETAAKTLDIARSSIWLYTDDHQYMNCADLYEHQQNRHSKAKKLSAVENPAYFRALDEGRLISAEDAHNHADTRDFREEYLDPLGISSMLDAPVRVEGKVLGAVCLEHIGPARPWSTDEQNFASSLADIVAMAIQASERRKTEQALRIARDKALSAERTMSSFLANMSHEIRTPLTSIIGFSESLLDRDKVMAERIQTINTIIRSGKHLLQLINDILDISKSEANKLEVECVSISPFELLSDVQALASLQAQDKGLGFSVNFSFPMPSAIYSDPLRLKQILINLCNNAIKFTDSGHIEVGVSCQRDDQQLCVEITDTGIGLTDEQQAKLFAPFSQADSSTTRKFGGTGLGLYLSKQLAERLGGTITVASVPKRGSTFTVTVATGSLDAVEFVDSAPRLTSDQDATAPVKRNLKGQVLLAEDNTDNQQLISLYIRSAGAQVTIAENGKQAVEKASCQDFDLVLMDMQMPVLDGLGATKQLRQLGYDKPIVALTANAYKEDREKCGNAGADGFLTKPIERKAFFDALAEYLPETEVTERTSDKTPIHSTLLEEGDEFIDLIDTFIEELPSMIKDLRDLYAEQRWDLLAKRLHDLKGVGGNYGFLQITEVAQRTEFELAKEAFSSIPECLDELGMLCAQIGLGHSSQNQCEGRNRSLKTVP